MEAISREFSVTYADDLVVIAETEDWKENVESKTKVMISGERQMVRQKYVRWPCGFCNKGVGSNSLQMSEMDT